ncbi:hypothetical protein ISN44_As11g021310 [Arabidopsis suecica]|uniref:Uncharacterized protein n=1 Tax=Arabidopsis suecica TaxID=45249 RepID=A0A8T1ZDC9_ARASU|nr:hypothetical protein ISN44_As11g021310 [Arabidopsis suecica]
MANRPLEILTGFPAPPSSATDPPPPPSRWWTQLHSLFLRRKELTEEEKSATFKPFIYGTLTLFAVMNMVLFLDIFFCHVSFSVESISVPPSSTTWHVNLLVNNPSSCSPINYNAENVYAKLGSINAAVLKTSRKHGSHGGHTSFSVDLATGENQSDVVAVSPRVAFELDMKLSGKKKYLAFLDEYGHYNIRCQNLTLGYQKTKCHSSFKASDSIM